MYLVFTAYWGHNKKVKIIYKKEIKNVIQSKYPWYQTSQSQWYTNFFTCFYGKVTDIGEFKRINYIFSFL